MGLILLSHHGLLLSTTYYSWTTPFQLNSTRTKFSLVLELDRYHLLGPFQFKLRVQCSSNYGRQGFFPLRNFTCFTAVTKRRIRLIRPDQRPARRKREGNKWSSFGSLNRRSSGTRPHSIHYPCFSI